MREGEDAGGRVGNERWWKCTREGTREGGDTRERSGVKKNAREECARGRTRACEKTRK